MITGIRYCLLTLALALSACTTPAQKKSPPAVVQRSAAPAAPQVVNLTPFPVLLLTGDDAAGHYYSLVAKATFSIREDGALQLLGDGERVIDRDPDPSKEHDCESSGAAINQITTWFPYTGFLIEGGKLEEVKTSSGKKMPLRSLTDDGSGAMQYRGPQVRTPEYYYAPCVGVHHVSTGWRLDDYLPSNARIRIKPASGAPLDLTLPQPFVPFVLLRYVSGAMIPTPMRVVLVTVDLPQRRVVLQYQGTFATIPALRKVEFRGIFPGGKPASDETAERYEQRTQATLDDLAQCAPPRVLAIEPCANASRIPNLAIFGQSRF
ncbi:MAG: hypothetical protein E6K53_13030 [Gammaproteobacteria bacterium]|nr:MAG: hypothetical protein E6K53_13030 [Gammaproteobacteria bacterium]